MTESLITPPGTPGAAGPTALEASEESGVSSLLYPDPQAETALAADRAPGSKSDGSPDGEEEANARPPAYEPFSLPQGIEIDSAALAEAQSLFAEARLSQPQAQKLVDLYAGRMGALVEAQVASQIAAVENLQKAWIAEVKSDPELGGQHFEGARAAAQRALARFGSPELRRSLDELGVSNSPQLFRFFVRVGQSATEDDWGARRPRAPALSAAETLYPHQNTNKE